MWEGRALGRPCIAVVAPNGRARPAPPPRDAAQKWLDPAWVVPDALTLMENRYWGGEATPSYLLMSGWVVCFGGRPHLDMETIWHEPLPIDFERPPAFAYDPDEPWLKRHEALYLAMAAAAGWDDFLVGQPLILPASDMLAALLGTETLLMSLIERPEWVKAALAQLYECGSRERRRLRELLKPRHRYWYGNAGWMPFWAPQPVLTIQSDVSCMFSAEMYEEFVLPELECAGRELGAMWYHLDGRDAKQHLPCLLSRPYLRVLQYTPTPAEPPNGPAHLDFYRQVQKAGKIVHIELPAANIEPLVRALDPALLMVSTWAATPRQAEELLADAARWTRG